MPASAPAAAHAGAQAHAPGGEANLVCPTCRRSGSARSANLDGHTLLSLGLIVTLAGLVFGLVIYVQLKKLPVHHSMREISELIYETCKTYLITQGKFILLLELFIGAIIVVYFGVLQQLRRRSRSRSSCCSAWSASPAATASPGSASASTPSPTRAPRSPASRASRSRLYAIPLKAGMSIGMLLISVELVLMLVILLFVPGDYAGACFIGFAIGESLGAAALRIAGGIFTKIADIGSDLMKIVFNIKEDDARNPGVIADCTGDNAGDSVGPTADGFETYGVTGVALITFILLAVPDADRPGPAPRLDLRDAHPDGHRQRRLLLRQRGDRRGALRRRRRDELRGSRSPSLVWLTSIVSIVAHLRRRRTC